MCDFAPPRVRLNAVTLKRVIEAFASGRCHERANENNPR